MQQCADNIPFPLHSNQCCTPGVESKTSSTANNHTLQKALNVKGGAPMHTKASFHNKEKQKCSFGQAYQLVRGRIFEENMLVIHTV